MSATVMEYIGKNISLISSSDVRYEGYLYTVDPEESTIALQNVNCMGTEQRRTGNDAIGPSQTTYEFIIFRVENIKKLYLHAEDNFGRKDITSEILSILDAGGATIGQRANKNDNNKPRESKLTSASSNEPKRRVGRVDYGAQRNDRNTYAYDYPYPANHDDNYYTGETRIRSPRQSQPYRRMPQQYAYQEPQMDNYFHQQRHFQNNFNRLQGNRMNTGGNYRHPTGGNIRNHGGANLPNRRISTGSGGARNINRSTEKPGTGNFLETSNLRGDEIEPPQKEFDFAAASERFNKAGPTPQNKESSKDESKTDKPETSGEDKKSLLNEVTSKIAQGLNIITGNADKNKDNKDVHTYDKNLSFFDELSTDINARTEHGRPDLGAQRQVDAQTFGSVAETYRSKHVQGGQRGGFNRRGGGRSGGRTNNVQQNYTGGFYDNYPQQNVNGGGGGGGRNLMRWMPRNG